MPGIKEVFLKYIKDKKYKGIIIMAAAGLLLVALSYSAPPKKEEIKETYFTFDAEEIRIKKEKELAGFLNKIDGISDCRVMIAYKDSGTAMYGFNVKNGDKTNEKEMVIRKENGKEYPVTEKISLPEIKGVTVICEGRKDMEAKVSRAVSAALGTDIHNVEVIINERN